MRRFGAIAALAVLAALTGSETGTGDSLKYSVPLKGHDDRVYAQTRSRYRITSASADFSLPDTPFQSPESRSVNGNRAAITIRCGAFPQLPARREPPREEDLADTPFLNLPHTLIRNAAAPLGRASDPVHAVEEFVYRHIDRKILGIPLISAREIMKNRSGDCTEHTVLATALLRSLGIPTRAVVGMVLVPSFGSERNVFVFHLWAEAFRDGNWRLVDATTPGEKHPNRYIALARHNLRTEMPRAYLRAAGAISELSIELLPAP